MSQASTVARLPADAPEAQCEFAACVIEGLSKARKTLPCRFFYDAEGSALFEEITRLPEYYPTRTEAAILAAHAREMVEGIPADGVLVEFGSGSSLKTERLLEQLPPSVAYVPIDISASALEDARLRLAARFPAIGVHPVEGDFSTEVEIPAALGSRPRVGFFPGSTIGNLTPPDAAHLLEGFARMLAAGSRLIIGVDLKKDARKLVEAYNDSAGVTAAFNLNILARINRELGAAIDLASFRHDAIYDPRKGRIEMHLVSTTNQELRICGRRFRIRAGESIHTENSYKYAIGEFQDLARAAGWHAARVWIDPDRQFSVHELVAKPTASENIPAPRLESRPHL